MKPLLSLDHASVFFDGMFSDPRLRHPEGIAVDASGAVWCGGETGEIYRIAPDGSRLELLACTGGFTLGLAFDQSGNLYTCDSGHAAIFRFIPSTGELGRFAKPTGPARLRIPNYVVVDSARGCLYVTDSYHPKEPGPGVWRFDLATGEGDLWYSSPLSFANGMALGPGGDSLYVIETFAQRVVQIPITADGAAGRPRTVTRRAERVPDGLVFDSAGNLYVTCYEPARIYRIDTSEHLDVLIEDPLAQLICQPANGAFRGSHLFTTNYGRWHITEIDVGITGLPLV